MEVERGDGVPDALQPVPRQHVLSADDHQSARLGARHQPIRGLVWDLDGYETQDGAGVDRLPGSENKWRPELCEDATYATAGGLVKELLNPMFSA